MMSPSILWWVFIVIFGLLPGFVRGAVSVLDPSTAWTPMLGNYDPVGDQKTGRPQGDIVGVGTNYGMFVTLNHNGNASATDGTWGFRLRLDAAGGTPKKPSFDGVAWVGIDADLNGSIDVFLGLNLQGSNREIGIYSLGSGSNTSPKTTSIVSKPYTTYQLTSDNFNYRPVDYETDGGTTNDLTSATKGDPDYYVSFMVPFADVVSFLAERSIQLTDQTSVRFVPATSTQTNSINEDFGGVQGGLNSTLTWEQLGAFTPMINQGFAPVPEPSSGLLVIISIAAGVLSRRRR